MEPNSGASVFADIISANLSGTLTPMLFMPGTGQTALAGLAITDFGPTIDITMQTAAGSAASFAKDVLERIGVGAPLNNGEDVNVARLQGYRDGLLDGLGASVGLGAGELAALETQADINVALGVAGM